MYAVFVRGKADKKVSNAGSGGKKCIPERVSHDAAFVVIYHKIITYFLTNIKEMEEKI